MKGWPLDFYIIEEKTTVMSKSKMMAFAAAVAVAVGTSACCSFNKCTTMPQDSLEDQANIPFVIQAQKAYEQRLNFSRPVMIRPSSKAQQFLTDRVARNYSSAFKRELLQIFEQALNEEVAKLRDFEIVSGNAGASDIGGATVMTGDEARSGNNAAYLMEFEITSISISDPFGGLVNIGTAFMENRRHENSLNQNKIWRGNAKIAVTLTAPHGKKVFNFSREVSCLSLPSPQPDGDLLRNAVKVAAQRVMKSYTLEFGPPMYVKQTIGGRHFVQISAGSGYGIKRGMKIEFFRNQPRTMPTLPGEAPKVENQRIRIATGTAGIFGAPIESDSAWVHVDDHDEELRKTLLWSSARVIE